MYIYIYICIYIYIYGSRSFLPNHYEGTFHVALPDAVLQKTSDGQMMPVLTCEDVSSSHVQMSRTGHQPQVRAWSSATGNALATLNQLQHLL